MESVNGESLWMHNAFCFCIGMKASAVGIPAPAFPKAQTRKWLTPASLIYVFGPGGSDTGWDRVALVEKQGGVSPRH